MRPPRSGQLQVDERDRPERRARGRRARGASAARSRARPRGRTARSAGRAAASASGCRPRARTRSPRATSRRSARTPGRRRARSRAGASSQRTSAQSRSATNARWIGCGSARVALTQTTGVSREAEARRDADDRRAGQAPDEERPSRRRPSATARSDSTVIRNAGSPIGVSRMLATNPSEHVRRVAGRVGRAEERQHRLELAGVPEPDAGHEPGPGVERSTEGARDERERRRRRPTSGCGALTIRGCCPRSRPTG